ncbi:hypothetical protein DFJ58DRAFT_838231 [Suillus subalutaceus]|uniref:uncharacterized protein n=1 Tax=Suillus subalutaceus TaxID=48586 RepID=UPI001B87A6CC|nr:uncharacterized protein DFJ58DRAFT_838231 [Suillus subalutaceus]KAG1867234.1 hypothetical protein DFJ58DRAFT_838231 [Suillus subalutaceus]
MSKFYVCSAGCNQNFANFTAGDLKNHEITHIMKYVFLLYGIQLTSLLFAHAEGTSACGPSVALTKTKDSYKIHTAKHAGEERSSCPHDDCDYKTHNPALLTKHRKQQHGYVPVPRGLGAPSGTRSQPPAQPPLPGTSYQYQPQPTQYQPPPPIHHQSLGVLYGSANTADEYTMYTGPVRAENGWTEGCMCPELMQRRPSEMPGYEYRRH